MWTQQQRDQRSLDRHRVIAERIRADPIVVDEAVKVIFRWQKMASKASHWYLYEWLKVLAMDLEDCVAAMVAPTEAGNALRQCSPFVRVFSLRSDGRSSRLGNLTTKRRPIVFQPNMRSPNWFRQSSDAANWLA